MDDELRPCPFCGGEVRISCHGTKHLGYWWSITRGIDKNTKCRCRLLMESEKFDVNNKDRKEMERRKLVTYWNTRMEENNNG